MTDIFDWADALDERRKRNNTDTTGMRRLNDVDTSIAAAERVVGGRKELQETIHATLIVRGPMTDGELEQAITHIGEKKLGPSTVRKRRSELFQSNRVDDTGQRRNGMKVWRAV